MKKKMLCLALACAMCLVGCGETEKKVVEEINVTETEQQPYEKIELPLPDSLLVENAQGSDYIGDDFEGYVADPMGKPAVYYSTYTREYEEYYGTVTRWQISEENDWVSEELCEESLSRYLNTKFEQNEWTKCSLSSFRRGDNGSLYGVFTYYMKETIVEDEKEKEQIVPKYSLLEIDEENDSVFEIPLLDVVGKPVEARGRNAWENELPLISDYHVFEDGNILLVLSDNGGGMASLVDGESGKQIQNLGNIVSGKTRFAFGESEVVMYSKTDNLFQVLSIPDMEEQNQFGTELTEEERSKDWYFHMNPNTWEMFLFNKEGVYQASNYQSGDEMELLTKGTDLSDVAEGMATILDFYVDDEGDFYVCMMETVEEYGIKSNMYRMIRYTKQNESK
nr:hypothetical protein [Eubacterium sp.]